MVHGPPPTATDPALASRLAEIVGEQRVLVRESELVAYSSDGLPSYNRRPLLAVFPGTRDEVVAVVPDSEGSEQFTDGSDTTTWEE